MKPETKRLYFILRKTFGNLLTAQDCLRQAKKTIAIIESWHNQANFFDLQIN